jgi:hypothetical protein
VRRHVLQSHGALRVEHRALMRVVTSGVLLALAACGEPAQNQTSAAAQSGAGTSSPPPTTAAGAAATSSPPAVAGRTAPVGPGATTQPAQAGTAGRSVSAANGGAGGAGATGGTGGPPTSTAVAGSAAAAGSGNSETSSAGAGGTSSPSGGTDCLAGITGYDKDGPFMYEAKVEGAVNVWLPKVPAGCKVPIIHLANGTGANCLVYADALTRMASHGFIATCYEDPNTGSGQQSLMAFKQTLEMHPDLADMKFGSTGHSQGGQAAFTGLQLAEAEWGDKAIYAGLAMEPASGFGVQPAMPWQQIYAMIKSPMFMFSGLGTDGLVTQAWVESAYGALSDSDEAYFWTASGATHIPVPNGEEEEISIPWFRWKLLGDQAACAYFKAIPMMDTRWSEVASKNVQDCQ